MEHYLDARLRPPAELSELSKDFTPHRVLCTPSDATGCYRAARDHWVAYDHPEDHWRLSARVTSLPRKYP
jgi:hypothetical protein